MQQSIEFQFELILLRLVETQTEPNPSTLKHREILFLYLRSNSYQTSTINNEICKTHMQEKLIQ